MLSALVTDLALQDRCRPLDLGDRASLTALVSACLPESAHVASRLEGVDWNLDAVAGGVLGVFLDGCLAGVVVGGRVVRALSASVDVAPAVLELLAAREGARPDAIVGPLADLERLVPAMPAWALRTIDVFSGIIGPTESPFHVAVPMPEQMAEFVSASERAAREELGGASPEGSSPARAAYWERQRESGRILGAFDTDGSCVFRVELRPALGRVAEMRGVWIAPRLRGQGHAHGLLAQTSAWATKHVAPLVCVYVARDNARAAHVYRRCGLAHSATLGRLEAGAR